MKAVQPFCDTSISKTVNIPADYPYEKFKDLYMYAWKSGLKGLATYRPNSVMDSVLSTKEEKPAEPTSVAEVVEEDTIDSDNGKTIDQIVKEMYTQSFESREDGSLPGDTVKGRFFTEQGEQKFLITINYLTLNRVTRYGTISIRRPVEFLLKSNFKNGSSSWDVNMRIMSLAARSGASIAKVIENLRDTTWEHGNVRYGTRLKEGRQIPLWHSSDAAALGFIIEEELKKSGYLTEEGKPALNYIIMHDDVGAAPIAQHTAQAGVVQASPMVTAESAPVLAPTGSKCPECGAYNVEKRDGCKQCSNCGWQDTCA
jgi:ribonucleoside-diphosphate reductase alpha chain